MACPQTPINVARVFTMNTKDENTSTCFVRFTLLALAILSVSSCAVLDQARSWEGTYIDSRFSLELLDSGQFSYRGSYLNDDKVSLFDFSGHYNTDGNWISLTTDKRHVDYIQGKKGFYNRFYRIRADGTTLLFSDEYMAGIASSIHNEYTFDGFHPLRLDRKEISFKAKPKTWLPQPYAGFAFGAPITGEVTNVENVKRKTVYNPVGGRIEGEIGYARITINVGSRDGVFEGLRFCSEQPSYLRLAEVENVDADHSIVTAYWGIPNGTQPGIGMKVSSICR